MRDPDGLILEHLIGAPWREDVLCDAGEVLERGFGFPGLVS